MGSSVFYNSPVNEGILYVPASSVNAYKAADQWKDWGQILPIPGTEVYYPTSGTCGKNLTWKYDLETGKLTIEGSGAMTSYNNDVDYPWHVYREDITEVSLPEGLTSIEDYALYRCLNLTSLYIPNTVTSIGRYAISNCINLTSVNIPNGIRGIAEGTFYFLPKLQSITIPSSVEVISDYGLYDCAYSSVTCLAKNPPSIRNDKSISYGGTLHVLPGCKAAYEADEPWNKFRKIVEDAFDTTTMVMNGWCGENLTWTLYKDGELRIEGSGDMIDYDSDSSVPWYSYRSMITKLTLPEGLTSIGNNAFYECTELTSVTIPGNVTIIMDDAFCRCYSLASVYIPNSVTCIGARAFRETAISSLNIPGSVEVIGGGAFQFCQHLTELVVPNSVIVIGDWAFHWCINIHSVTLPSSLSSIGSSAFQDCGNLRTVTCAAETTPRMGSSVFLNVPVNEGTLYVPASSVNAYKSADQWKSWGQILPIAGTDPILASGNCGANLTWAFYKSGELRIEGSGAMDTYKDAQSVPWYEYCKSITQLSLPEGLSSIGDFAFNGCSSLTSVILPNSVTSVGFYAFAGCDGLTTPVKNSKLFVYMPASYKGAYDIPNGIETIGKLAFKGCGELTNVNIPATVTSIGSSAFEGCSGLSSISIPATVTEIEMWAFQGCTGLESVTIGNGVAVIGEFAFYGCTRITSITLPQSVTRINSYAFNECNELREMVCKASTPPTVKSSAFGETTLEKGQLYVLGPCVNAYKAADGWKEWRQIRPIPGTEVLFTITAESADKSLGTVRGGGMFVEGETVTLTATASEDYRFTAWSDGSTSNPYTFTATRNVTLTASFEQLPPSERKMLELTDEMDYATIPAKKYESLEYIRQSGNAGQWEALSVPMRVDVMQNSQQAEFGEVYAIAPCRDTNGDGKVDEQDEYCVIVRKMDKGELQPNMPYFIRPLNDGGLKLQSVDNQFHAARTRPLSISVVTRIYSFIPQKQARNLNGKDEYVLEDAWLSGGPKAKGMGRPSRWVMSITPENPDKDSLPGEVGLFTLDEDVIETVVNGKRQFILLDDDTETAIDLARQQDSRGIHGVYTLDGRKMPDVQHLQPGIYIVNGKKVSSQHILSR